MHIYDIEMENIHDLKQISYQDNTFMSISF